MFRSATAPRALLVVLRLNDTLSNSQVSRPLQHDHETGRTPERVRGRFLGLGMIPHIGVCHAEIDSGLVPTSYNFFGKSSLDDDCSSERKISIPLTLCYRRNGRASDIGNVRAREEVCWKILLSLLPLPLSRCLI